MQKVFHCFSYSLWEDLLLVTEEHVQSGPTMPKLQNHIPASTVWLLTSNVRSRCKIYGGTLILTCLLTEAIYLCLC